VLFQERKMGSRKESVALGGKFFIPWGKTRRGRLETGEQQEETEAGASSPGPRSRKKESPPRENETGGCTIRLEGNRLSFLTQRGAWRQKEGLRCWGATEKRTDQKQQPDYYKERNRSKEKREVNSQGYAVERGKRENLPFGGESFSLSRLGKRKNERSGIRLKKSSVLHTLTRAKKSSLWLEAKEKTNSNERKNAFIKKKSSPWSQKNYFSGGHKIEFTNMKIFQGGHRNETG